MPLTKFDPADYLDDKQALAAYVSDALKTGDPAFLTDALGVVARAKGMASLATETGLSRESLYKSLSVNGNPELATILKVTKALGLRLVAIPAP